jgi:hypothetical protein
MTIPKFVPKTQQDYVQRIKNFAAFLGRSPDTASFEDVRRYQLHLAESGIGVPTINQTVTIVGCSKTADYGVKNVDVASHRPKRNITFDQNGGRRGRFSVDCASPSIARVLLGRRYHHRHHAINSWRGLDRL